MIDLYGSYTSPFVRRVRVVCAELGLACTIHNTNQEAVQKEVAKLTPIRKIPIARIFDEVVFDSHSICEKLLSEHPHQGIDLPQTTHEKNVVSVIDSAADTSVTLFYLLKDSPEAMHLPSSVKQSERISSALQWLDAYAPVPDAGRLTLLDIYLQTTLEWMQFRSSPEITPYTKLMHALSVHAARKSMRDTAPKDIQ